jgi:hypothetical protein
MPESNVLDRLLSFGIEKGFFEEKLLAELDKSCCPCSQIKVIDFDVAKEKILGAEIKIIISDTGDLQEQATNRQQPKSADAIRILPNKNQIDFIELKGFEKFICRNRENKNIEPLINAQIEKLNLKIKIFDSLHVLYSLILDGKFRASNEEKDQYIRSTKNYFIVVDISLYKDPMKARSVTLDLLSQDLSIEEKILKSLNQKVSGIPESSFENFQKPKLFSCSQIERHYISTSQ